METEYKILNHIGVVHTYETSGWRKELNIVSWNNQEPRYDIRDWSEDHTHMSRGLTFTPDEFFTLYSITTEHIMELLEAEGQE